MSGAAPEFPPQLIGEESLFRALRNRAQQQDKRQAFLLRNDERDSGLSVKFNCTPDDCENELKEKSYGVLSLVARPVTALGLRVIPDEPSHANIKDVPHKDDDPERAMLLAGKLSGIATTIREGLKKTNVR